MIEVFFNLSCLIRIPEQGGRILNQSEKFVYY